MACMSSENKSSMKGLDFFEALSTGDNKARTLRILGLREMDEGACQNEVQADNQGVQRKYYIVDSAWIKYHKEMDEFLSDKSSNKVNNGKSSMEANIIDTKKTYSAIKTTSMADNTDLVEIGIISERIWQQVVSRSEVQGPVLEQMLEIDESVTPKLVTLGTLTVLETGPDPEVTQLDVKGYIDWKTVLGNANDGLTTPEDELPTYEMAVGDIAQENASLYQNENGFVAQERTNSDVEMSSEEPDDVIIKEVPMDDYEGDREESIRQLYDSDSGGENDSESEMYHKAPSTNMIEYTPRLNNNATGTSGVGEQGEKEKKKKKNMGLCGFRNLGNTCYMNSALQCLSNTWELTEYFLSGVYTREVNVTNPLGMKGEIAKQYGKLMEKVWQGYEQSFGPVAFKHTIGKFAPQFVGYRQQDAPEFLAFLLDGLHEDLNRILDKPYVEIPDAGGRADAEVAAEQWEVYKKRNDSVIVDLFQGQLRSVVTCPECNWQSNTFDPFMYLTLLLPTKKHIDISVLFVPIDSASRPIVIKMQVGKDEKVDKVCEMIAEITKKQLDTQIFISEVFDSRIYKIMNGDHVENMGEENSYTAFEYPASVEKKTVVQVVFAQGKKDAKYTSGHMPIRRRPMGLYGHPILISFNRDDANEAGIKMYQLYIEVLEGILRFSVPSAAIVMAEIIKVLKGVENDTSILESLEESTKQVISILVDAVSFKIRQSPSAARYKPLKTSTSAISFKESEERGEATPAISDDEEMSQTETKKPQFVIPPQFVGFENFLTNNNCAELINSQQDASDEQQTQVESVNEILNTSVVLNTGDILVCNIDFEILSELNRSTQEGEQYGEKNENVQSSIHQRIAATKAWFDFGTFSVYNAVQTESMTDDSIVFPKINVFDADSWNECVEMATMKESRFGNAKSTTLPSVSIYDCLNEYTREEQLGADDSWFCSKCKDFRQATKKLDIWRLPEILVIHLKRFEHLRAWSKKLDTYVDFPICGLDLSDAVLSLKSDPSSTKKYVYDLYAVSNHYGGFGGGHYTAFAQNPHSGDWFGFNDSLVSPLNDPESSVKSDAAYVLFYRLRPENPASTSATTVTDLFNSIPWPYNPTSDPLDSPSWPSSRMSTWGTFATQKFSQLESSPQPSHSSHPASEPHPSSSPITQNSMSLYSDSCFASHSQTPVYSSNSSSHFRTTSADVDLSVVNLPDISTNHSQPSLTDNSSSANSSQLSDPASSSHLDHLMSSLDSSLPKNSLPSLPSSLNFLSTVPVPPSTRTGIFTAIPPDHSQNFMSLSSSLHPTITTSFASSSIANPPLVSECTDTSRENNTSAGFGATTSEAATAQAINNTTRIENSFDINSNHGRI
ncbi:Ubiquitin carboxyl-terminal hydrolase 4 [Zancudomyces culisetae]|uniref:ubiquitinyl hydrolase 1 n=1 Tax=Zancudomyces culisetae TaxID=1213189 RepID=A0A1R1PPY2_ZANCU|nr:Ubiquitin carboxyl-terminal hydrolase 4 [Zancudomyces culisetae]|eukprot:OMH83045.1 Ubiquitin carboxyl-terminal hydrolase 4 [Zancudomyces culisetae]